MTQKSLQTEEIKLRVSPHLKKQIKRKANEAGLTVSEFLRLSAQQVTIVYRPHEFVLSNAVNAVGNLQNQIARYCHFHPQNPFTNQVVASLVHSEVMLEQILWHAKEGR